MTSTPFYQRHIFFCINERENGEASCGHQGAKALQEHAKKRVKQLGLNGPGQVRVNKAGCLDRCEKGPVCVVYPEGVWYTMVDTHDVDEIVEQHLAQGKIVERLAV